jgi:hypothetical protein
MEFNIKADGTIDEGRLIYNATSNCALDNKNNYLYITADDYVMRIKLK